MQKIILSLLILLFNVCLANAQYHYHPVKAANEHHHKKLKKHEHDPDVPDPSEEAKELRKMQRHARKERASEQLEKDKENIKYEKKRYKGDRPSGIYEGVSKAGIRQHKKRLKEDKNKSE